MARKRTRPIHPYIQRLMEEVGASTLKEYSEATRIPYETLRSYADIDGRHQVYAALVRDAHLAGKSLDEFVRGMLEAS